MLIGLGLSTAAVSLRRGIVPPVPTLPPADWRLPATVTTSAGLSGSQSALAAASSSAASKSRPGITLAGGAAEYIEWTVQESGTALLSFVPSTNAGTYSVTKNGADLGFVKQAPSGSDEVGNSNTGKPGRRQVMAIPVVAGDALRLAIAASGALEVHPLLHLKPATGPWDATMIYGASNETYGLASRSLEDAVIAEHPSRDPLVFNFGRAGFNLSDLATNAAATAAVFNGAASYAYCGSIMGNTISAQRPWDSAETAAMTADLQTIHDAFTGAGMQVWYSSTSYRAYTAPDVTPEDQSAGSLPYDQNVLFPFMAANAPYAYDTALGRARVDSYLFFLNKRALLSDQVHWSQQGYLDHQAYVAERFFARLYSGAWGADTQIEQRVADAEAASNDQLTALLLHEEAQWAMLALPASAAKTAFQGRLDAVYPTTLFYEAKRLIDVAEAAATQDAKDAAQAMLNAAQTAGYAGATAPNTIAVQQGRIDAIVVASYAWEALVDFNTVEAYNAPIQSIARPAGAGVIIADVRDINGNLTGMGLSSTDPIGSNSNNGTVTSGVSAIPDPMLNVTWTESGNSGSVTLTGLDTLKTYDLVLMASRNTSAGKAVKFTVQGAVQAPEYDAAGNTTNANFANGIVPNGAGEIEIIVARGTGSSFAYITAMRVSEKV